MSGEVLKKPTTSKTQSEYPATNKTELNNMSNNVPSSKASRIKSFLHSQAAKSVTTSQPQQAKPKCVPTIEVPYELLFLELEHLNTDKNSFVRGRSLEISRNCLVPNPAIVKLVNIFGARTLTFNMPAIQPKITGDCGWVMYSTTQWRTVYLEFSPECFPPSTCLWSFRNANPYLKVGEVQHLAFNFYPGWSKTENAKQGAENFGRALVELPGLWKLTVFVHRKEDPVQPLVSCSPGNVCRYDKQPVSLVAKVLPEDIKKEIETWWGWVNCAPGFNASRISLQVLRLEVCDS